MPDKTANSAAKFLLEDVIEPCPYLIECVYSDNGTEYKVLEIIALFTQWVEKNKPSRLQKEYRHSVLNEA